MFLLTYDDHPDIRDMYGWAPSTVSQRWTYTIGRTDDQQKGLKKQHGFRRARGKGRELFISNYQRGLYA